MNIVRTAAANTDRIAWGMEHDRCQLCGIGIGATYLRAIGGLYTHEIIGGAGRSFERCNYLRLCERDHAHYHDGGGSDDQGNKLPNLTLGIMLTIKRDSGEDWNPERLEELNRKRCGKLLPKLVEVPGVFLAERVKHGVRE